MFVHSKKSERSRAALVAVALAGAAAMAAVACKKRSFNNVKSTGKEDYKSKLVEQLPADGSWETIFKQRDQAYVGYLTDPKLGKENDWFFHKPLGLNGLPYLAVRVLVKMYPDIWTKYDTMYNKLGFPPWPTDYEGNALTGWSGNLKDASKRSPLPYGFVSWKDFTQDANSVAGSDNVFFSCAACHTARVVKDGRVRYYPGGASTQVEAQLFASLLYQSVSRLTNVEDLAYGKVSPQEVKPSSPIELGEVLRFFSEMRGFCKAVNAGNPYKVGLPDGGKKECEEQRDLLLAGISPSVSETQLAASLADVTYDDDVAGNYQKASLVGIAKGVGSENSNFKKLLKNVIGAGVKTAIMYYNVGVKISFSPKGRTVDVDVNNREFEKVKKSVIERDAPPLFEARPGQMDAFGLVQGVAYLNAARPDLLMWKYFPNNEFPRYSGPYIEGYDKTSEYKDSLLFAKDQATMEQMRGDVGKMNGVVHQNAAKFLSQAAALSDIKSLFRSSEEHHANWDGNEGAGARVLASGLSSVGDPTKVFTEIHDTQNAYIDNLPAPPYPFASDEGPDFYQKALKGQELFNKGCAECHHRKNAAIYNVGTDPNRAHAIYSPFVRLALISLTRAACDWGKQRELLREQKGEARLDGKKTGIGPDGKPLPYWCELHPDGKPFESYAALTDDVLRDYRGENAGYKADPLYGVWLDSPYLHNGSVPSLRDLFKPTRKSLEVKLQAVGKPFTIQDSQVRPNTFLRGNPYYNVKQGGYEYREQLTRGDKNTVPQPRNSMQYDDVIHTAQFDSNKRGNGNDGHEFWHDEVTFDKATGEWKGTGREWSAEEIDAVIAYLKTL